MEDKKKILLGLTTTAGSDWRDKVEEIKELNLTELALFPTFLNPQERQELYGLLEQTPLVSLPYVHLRDDFSDAELDLLINRYKTKVFSCHSNGAGYALLNRLPKYNSLIYVENPANAKEMPGFSAANFTQYQVTGLCLDLSHLAVSQLTDKKLAAEVAVVMKRWPLGVNHISGFSSNAVMRFFHSAKANHHLNSLTELDYLKDLPASYFAKYICLELENSFLEQNEVKQYLDLILAEKL